MLSEWLTGIFGYRLAQVGAVTWPAEDPPEAKPIGQKILLHTSATPKWSSVIAEPPRLPLATESMDLLVLPHTLDFCTDPQGVLREAERVLIPNGRLITMSFRSWSLWGVRRAMAGLTGNRRYPWNANFIGYMRLSDWLSLLGLEIERTEVMMFRPPWRTEGMMKRGAFLEKAGRRFWPVLAAV